MQNLGSSIRAIARKIRTYRNFSIAERRLVRTALPLLCFARVALWILPLRRVRSAADRLSRVRRARRDISERQVGWAIRVASHYVPRATCLAQGVAAQILLSRYGYASRLHIGVALENRFEAHAWVESNGLVVVGGAEESARYTPILAMNARRD
jgi:hypothetical protein